MSHLTARVNTRSEDVREGVKSSTDVQGGAGVGKTRRHDSINAAICGRNCQAGSSKSRKACGSGGADDRANSGYVASTSSTPRTGIDHPAELRTSPSTRRKTPLAKTDASKLPGDELCAKGGGTGREPSRDGSCKIGQREMRTGAPAGRLPSGWSNVPTLRQDGPLCASLQIGLPTSGRNQTGLRVRQAAYSSGWRSEVRASICLRPCSSTCEFGPGVLNTIPVQALVDTGSRCSILAVRIYEKILKEERQERVENPIRHDEFYSAN